MHRQLVALLHKFHHLLHIAEIELRRDPLAVEIHRQGHQTDVPGALPVTEQATFHPVGTRQQGELGAGNAAAAIVMGMDADADLAPTGEVAAEILDLIGIDVWGVDLHRGRQVDDHRPFGRGFPDIRHRLADVQGKLRFGKAEGFRRILIGPARLRVGLAQRAYLPRGADRQLHNLLLALTKDQLAEQRRGGVIEMHRGAFCPIEGNKGALNQIAAGLGKHLNGDIIRDALLLNQLADKLKVRFGCGGERHLNLLEAAFEQLLPEAQLAGDIHRFRQRLVAVTQVG